MTAETIEISEEVYDRLHARKRDNETVDELLDRLLKRRELGWRKGFGSLSAEDAEAMRKYAAESRERFSASLAERQVRQIERSEFE